jgi:hypothetical protein
MTKNVIKSPSKSDKCEEHKQIVLSPSVEMCERISLLRKKLSFRNNQAVIEMAISRFYQEEMRRYSEIASDQVEDDGR